MIAWLTLLGTFAVAGGLEVDTSTPDALCPDLGQVRELAQARLGDIEAEGAWRASYALIHRPDRSEAGDVVRLELRDPVGHLRLRRELPRAGESCAALAGALVVVLDAYFRHPSDAATPAPETGAPAETLAARRQPAAPPEPRLALDLTGGWTGGWAGAERSSPLLALGLRIAALPPVWWVGLEAAWLLDQRAEQPADTTVTATERSFAGRVFLSRDLARDLRGGSGATALLIGPEAVMALDRADGAMLFNGRTDTRVSFGGGLRAHAQIAVASQLHVGVLATFDYLPSAWGGSFWVDRLPAMPTEIFPAPRARLSIGAGLSWAVF